VPAAIDYNLPTADPPPPPGSLLPVITAKHTIIVAVVDRDVAAALSQHSVKQAQTVQFDTRFDADDVAHTSPFKRDCDRTCTESLYTGNDAGIVNMWSTRAQRRFVGGFKLFEVKIHSFSHRFC
jgi:hypothetical protein